MKLLKDTNGFSPLEVALAVIVMGLIGGTGYYAYQKTNNPERQPKTTTKTSQTSKAAPVTTKTYSNSNYGFSFQYPSNWKFKEDLKDVGRGALEGDITVTSPVGTVVTFNANQGGKGGDCIDEQNNDQRSTRTCYTRQTLKLESFASGMAGINFYYYQTLVTPPTRVGGESKYETGIADDRYATPEVGSLLTDADVDTLTLPGGDLDITVVGKDDGTNANQSFLSSTEVNEAKPVLKSLQLLDANRL